MENINLIKEKLTEIKLDLSAEKIGKLESYVELLEKWNKAYNLVGRSTLEEIYSRHVLDSLQLVQYVLKRDLKEGKILDFGAGAGMPSVMLAIVLDDVEVIACERIGKKCQFLNNARRELGLTNLIVKQDDVRNISDIFDVITCRAVASLKDIFELTEPVKQSKQAYILPKGCNFKEEILEANNAGFNFEYEVSKSIINDDSVILEIEH